MNKIKIDETKMFHNKKVNHFEEWFNEETRKNEFFIVFDGGQKLKIEPCIDKDNEFESQRENLRLNYYINSNKESIVKKLNETVDLSKNLQEPHNEEEQSMLDDIMNEIKDLDNYIDEISK